MGERGGYRRSVRAAAAALGFAALANAGPATAGAAPGGRRAFTHGDVERVTLAAFAAAHGLAVEDRAEAGLWLGRRNPTLRLMPGGRRASIRGVQVWLQHPLERVGDDWVLARVDADATLSPLLRPHRYLAGRTPGAGAPSPVFEGVPYTGARPALVVVLDPGHGGADGGASGPDGLLEKDLALDLARRTRTRLERAGLRVHLTREDDRFVDLADRPALAARLRADVFVSIHLNASDDPSAAGVETYVLSKPGFPSTNHPTGRPSPRWGADPGNAHDAANAILGFLLQRRMLGEGRARDRGLRHARFLVLRQAPCPAALVECGFLTNAGDARRLADEGARARMADAIALGILDYANEVRRARLVNW